MLLHACFFLTVRLFMGAMPVRKHHKLETHYESVALFVCLSVYVDRLCLFRVLRRVKSARSQKIDRMVARVAYNQGRPLCPFLNEYFYIVLVRSVILSGLHPGAHRATLSAHLGGKPCQG